MRRKRYKLLAAVSSLLLFCLSALAQAQQVAATSKEARVDAGSSNYTPATKVVVDWHVSRDLFARNDTRGSNNECFFKSSDLRRSPQTLASLRLFVRSGPEPRNQAGMSPRATLDYRLSLAGTANASAAASAEPQAGGADAQELAKQLSNPVASLVSVPFQSNFDFGMGADDDGYRYTMNLQPVIPFSLNKEWNLISRTILPIINQDDVVGRSRQAGLGDITQSFFFSPAKTEPFIWGLGPVLLIPTATDGSLGTEKFGLGPTLVILKQQGQWTYGALLNHIWSVAGDDDRADVNSTFIQPFLSYTTRTAWTYTFNLESSYDWTGEHWSIPIHFTASKLVRFGRQPVSFGGALRCWATTPDGGPAGCGFRIIVTPLFPKRG